MVRHIRRDLKKCGVLIEQLRLSDRRLCGLFGLRPGAVKKPEGYRAIRPGSLVEVDTLSGVVRKYFTARYLVTRWDVVQAHSHAKAATVTQFLESSQQRTSLPIKALQVDGGSEFAAELEQACQQRGLLLFVLPLGSP